MTDDKEVPGHPSASSLPGYTDCRTGTGQQEKWREIAGTVKVQGAGTSGRVKGAGSRDQVGRCREQGAVWEGAGGREQLEGAGSRGAG